jgi:hypothetical protein
VRFRRREVLSLNAEPMALMLPRDLARQKRPVSDLAVDEFSAVRQLVKNATV